MSISDAVSVLEDNIFNNTTCSVLRGFADLSATNTFMGGNLSLIREESVQLFYLDGIHASGSAIAGLVLSGGNYFVGPNTVLQNNAYPVALEGGLLSGSAIHRPATLITRSMSAMVASLVADAGLNWASLTG